MNQNMALLSQTEIDTLLDFLQKSKVGEEVMDQGSIDRLINLLQTDQKREIKFDTDVPQVHSDDGQPLLLLEGLSSAKEQSLCVLECQVDAQTQFLHIFCRDESKDKEYEITPACISEMRFSQNDKSSWGYAIPPVTFDHIASLMMIKYTKSVFDKVCHIFAQRMFGGEWTEIPELYMPTTYDLIHHLKD
ncbi:MAG: hypothetical protein K2N63_14310 [Lachnospiraceae bacterium]|nr:hypothetical protein [Lachnospiraceae bacterium]